MKVEIFGTGCVKCNRLEKQVRDLVEREGLDDVEVEKVKRLDRIVDRGIMMTPALAVDGEVKAVGSVPKESEILGWIEAARGKVEP